MKFEIPACLVGKYEIRADGCWWWTRAKTNGYGVQWTGYGRRGGRVKRATRIMLEAKLGRPITSGMFCCHTCDNPACVNPSHLREWTQKQNLADMSKKGRSGSHVHPERVPRGDRHPSRTRPECFQRGEGHYKARLTADAVLQIVRMRSEGAKLREISEIFCVNISTVSKITNKKNWRSVTCL